MNGRVEKILIANRSIRKMFLECKEHVTRKFDFQKNRTTVKKRPRGEDKVEMKGVRLSEWSWGERIKTNAVEKN